MGALEFVRFYFSYLFVIAHCYVEDDFDDAFGLFVDLLTGLCTFFIACLELEELRLEIHDPDSNLEHQDLHHSEDKLRNLLLIVHMGLGFDLEALVFIDEFVHTLLS